MKDTTKILIIILVSTIIFMVITFALWYAVSTDPISGVAMPYLWNTEEVTEDISEAAYDGKPIEITHIGRKIIEPTYEDEDTIQVPFGVHIGKGEDEKDFLVYVTLEKTEDGYVAIDHELYLESRLLE